MGSIQVLEENKEMQNLRGDNKFLDRIAKETGGKFYPQLSRGAISEIIDDVINKNQSNRKETVPLWDNWITLILILSLFAIEWIWRRKKALP